jgi:hypothetical protein
MGPVLPRKRHAGWSGKLARSLTLKDGTEMVTLADARDVLRNHLATEVENIELGQTLRLLLAAAKTGSVADRRAATDQVEIVLRWREATARSVTLGDGMPARWTIAR